MPVFHSGAFLQQCFAVHPLSLTVKVWLQPDKIGVLCTQCQMRHRLTSETFYVHVGSEIIASSGTPKSFQHCVTDHPEELRIGAVDIDQKTVQLRCRLCHQAYRVDVRAFETYRP
ncbi:MAG: hypothetical protein D6690_15255 [Nitrospirae bacterium]|nr:MAG: hypothetical protein D6690_15255 [Nitrospirota bacterium]